MNSKMLVFGFVYKIIIDKNFMDNNNKYIVYNRY